MTTSSSSLPSTNTHISTTTPIFLLSNISNYVTIKLDHSNYLMWKFQITGILDAYSLLDHLEDPTPCPPKFLFNHPETETQEVNPLYTQWRARDKALFSLISSTLSPSAISLVMGQTSASGIWKILVNRYTSISRSNIVNLKRELNSIKKNSDSVTDYLHKIKEVRNKLVSVGILIDDEEILHIVLQGLSSEFHSFTSAMLTKNEAVKFEELHTLMKTKEDLLRSATENSKEIAHMAMVANKTSQPMYNNSSTTQFGGHRGRGRNHNRGRGSNGGRFQTYNNGRGGFSQGNFNNGGNFSNFTPNSPNPQSWSNPSSHPSCQICYKLGHAAIDCYQHIGATDHFTLDLHNIPDNQAYTDSQLVSVGNGTQLPISHSGPIPLVSQSPFRPHNPEPTPEPIIMPLSTNEPEPNLPQPRPNQPEPTLPQPGPHLNPISSTSLSSPNISTVPPAPPPENPAPPPANPAVPLPSHPMQTRSKSGISKKKCFATSTTVDYLQTEPPTYTIASKFPQWREAMASEFAALQRQHTWQLVPHSSDQNVVGCRWVYKIKRNSDGSVSRYKACLVAKGFHQQAGVDFAETFSPVVKPPTVRIILSLAAQNRWSLRQLDVSNAFLHGLLKETVFMAQPLGFVNSTLPSHVCHLHKSLYGLKQAPRAWFERFTSHLLTLGFKASVADASLFILSHGSVTVYLLLYVDDIIITGNSSTAVSNIISQLFDAFELKDLGPLRYFLGLQIDYKKGGFFVHQRKYLTDLLHKFTMTDCKPASTPIATTLLLTSTSTDLLSDPTPYRSTLDRGLLFQPGPFALTAFTDADWAGDPCDRRSTSSIIVFLGNNPITWLAKKQHTISRSSTEAEYRSLASGAAELAWIRQVLCDLGLFLPSAPLIWCDNTSALALASNPVFHGRTKHIEVDYHFIRERVVRGDITLQFISTDDQLADVFTKALPSPRFHRLCSKLLVCSTDHQFEGG
uniref:Reverse transcriptase Ty1/copia-type domain-containing protein n=1 Tax=Fagus sylvatica TaxID=28930 RepID=A0A2N9EHZ0_FAGSY